MRTPFALLFFLAFNGCVPTDRTADKKAVAGQLDLTQHDFGRFPLVVLGGEWDFFKNRLISAPAEIQSVLPERAVLPQTWSGDGYGTYRLKIRLPEKLPDNLAVHMEAQLSAYDLVIAGKLSAASGKPGMNLGETIPGTSPLTAVFPASREIEILLRVSNYHHRKGGVFKKIQFGTAAAVDREIQSKRILDALFTGILGTMALYHFVIFALRRRNRAALAFAVVCLMIAGRTITTGEKLLLVVWPAAPFNFYTMLEYLSYFWSIPFALRFFYELYPDSTSKWLHRIFKIIAGLFSVVVFFTPLRIYSHTAYLYMPVMAAGILLVAWLLIRGAWRRDPNAAALAAGFLALALAVANDSLNTLEILRTGYVVHFGFLGIVLIYASVLAARFSRALDDSESAAMQLQVANETLESRVSERTIEFERAKDAAEQANKLKDNFIALVSHDLRSPLSGLYGVLQTVRLAPVDEQKKKQLLGMAEKSASDVLQMIESLLQLHRFKQGKGAAAYEIVQPFIVVDEVINSLAASLSEKNVRIVNEISPRLQLKTDVALLRHVLRNLVTNAIKYSHPASQIFVTASGKDATAIAVKDSGVGMDARQVAALLGREQTVSTAGTGGEKGSGLGLAICREMLHNAGGELAVESDPGKGSIFTIHLPVSPLTGTSL